MYPPTGRDAGRRMRHRPEKRKKRNIILIMSRLRKPPPCKKAEACTHKAEQNDKKNGSIALQREQFGQILCFSLNLQLHTNLCFYPNFLLLLIGLLIPDPV